MKLVWKENISEVEELMRIRCLTWLLMTLPFFPFLIVTIPVFGSISRYYIHTQLSPSHSFLSWLQALDADVILARRLLPTPMEGSRAGHSGVSSPSLAYTRSGREKPGTSAVTYMYYMSLYSRWRIPSMLVGNANHSGVIQLGQRRFVQSEWKAPLRKIDIFKKNDKSWCPCA